MSESKSTAHAGHHHGCCAAAANEKPHGAGSDQVIDPVCGMTVDPAKTPHHADHESKTWHFCSAGCRSKFMADPEQYLTRSEEHTSELQSLMRTSYAVFCLKKKTKKNTK